MALQLPNQPAPAAGAAGPVDPRKARNRRALLAVGGGAVLALIFLLQRRAQQPTDAQLVGAQPTTAGGTFADNGDQAAGLADAIGSQLADQQTSFGNLQSAIEALAQTLTDNKAQPNNPAGGTSTQPVAGQPAAAAPAPAPAVAPTLAGQLVNKPIAPTPTTNYQGQSTPIYRGVQTLMSVSSAPAPTAKTRTVKGATQWYWNGNWHTVRPPAGARL